MAPLSAESALCHGTRLTTPTLSHTLFIADDVHAAAHDGPSTSGAAAAAAAAAGKGGNKRGRDGKPLLGKAQAQRRKGGGVASKDEEFGVTRGIDFKVGGLDLRWIYILIKINIGCTANGPVRKLASLGPDSQWPLGCSLNRRKALHGFHSPPLPPRPAPLISPAPHSPH